MSKKHILVVDDDEALRDAYNFALTEEYAVQTAEDGQDGVSKFKASRPDMVFLDLRMPRMDGIAALREMRRLSAKLPIYIVTAFAREYLEELDGARREGLEFEIASKPLSSQQILAIAHAALSA